MKNYLELEIGLSSMVKKGINKEFKEEVKKEVFLIVVVFIMVEERLGGICVFWFCEPARGGVYVTPLGQELALDYPRQADGSPHIIHKLFCNARQVSDIGADSLAEPFPVGATTTRYDNTL